MFFKSELTVSAMPLPIQSSAGSRVMLTNVITATERSMPGCVECRPAATRLVVPRGALARHIAQVALHVPRRLVTEGRRLLERAGDDGVKRSRDHVGESRRRRRDLVKNAIDDLGRGTANERRAAGRQLEQHDAEREEIG